MVTEGNHWEWDGFSLVDSGMGVPYDHKLMMNLVELATRLKSARQKAGLTLDQLADRSGVAKGVLSKVENFRVTPSLPSLIKIVGALEIPLEKIFEGIGAEQKNAISVVKKKDRVEVERDAEKSSIRYFDMVPSQTWRKMDPFELRVPPGGGRSELLTHEGEEFLTVLNGAISFVLGEDTYQLKAGDSAYFNAEIPHGIQNPGRKEAKVLCVFLERF
jgi:transcriptional regulator with XRE-family HTH domain